MEATKTEVFLGADDSKTTGATVKTKDRKIDLDKVTSGIQKTQQGLQAGAGLLDTVKGIFGKGKQDIVPVAAAPAPDAPKEKMSTTTKVLIGVGAAVVLGGIIYFATRKK
jgi:hypothetical protein